MIRDSNGPPESLGYDAFPALFKRASVTCERFVGDVCGSAKDADPERFETDSRAAVQGLIYADERNVLSHWKKISQGVRNPHEIAAETIVKPVEEYQNKFHGLFRNALQKSLTPMLEESAK